MKRSFRRIGALLLLSMATVYGCGDRSDQVVPSVGPSGGLISTVLGTLGLTKVSVLTRTKSLASDISVSAEIGKDGGVIEIPQAGLKVAFPRNALVPPGEGEKIRITVTALQGNEVAYTFAPHGLAFREPVLVTQSYAGTPAETNSTILRQLEGGYFPSLDLLDPLRAVAQILEFRPTTVDPATKTVRFPINHFSGYLVVSGRR